MEFYVRGRLASGLFVPASHRAGESPSVQGVGVDVPGLGYTGTLRPLTPPSIGGHNPGPFLVFKGGLRWMFTGA